MNTIHKSVANTPRDPASVDDDEDKLEDGESASNWVEKYADYLFRFASSRIANQDCVEEIIQDTFLSALRTYSTFEGKSSVQTWLTSILRRKIADYYRRAQRENKIVHSLGDVEVDADSERTNRLRAWPSKASAALEGEDFWDVFRSCSEKLPPILAESFQLREVNELSTTTVCEQLNISPNALSTRLFRARTLLRTCLDKNWFNPVGVNR